MAASTPTQIDAWIERNVPIPMRDGTVLRADVFRPAREAPHDVLLIRNPYGEATGRNVVSILDAISLGIAVVAQDTRGSYRSDGVFEPFAHEEFDGADSLEWCSRQPWSTGALAMIGPSYLGATQLLAAKASPRGLRAIAPTFTASDYFDGWAYQGGAFQLGFMLHWAAGFAAAAKLRLSRHTGDSDRADVGDGENVELPSDYSRLPLSSMPGLLRYAPYWLDWVNHHSRDMYWRALEPLDNSRPITTPAIHVGGWFDIFLKGTLTNYVTFRNLAANAKLRRQQRLVIGPWAHGPGSQAIGELDFGPSASQAAAQLETSQLAFITNAFNDDFQSDFPPVRLFVMGDNAWRDEDDWPLNRAVVVRHYFHSDLSLSQSPPSSDEEPSLFVYDPLDPVPTVGGPTLLPGAEVGFNAGPRNQSHVETRHDILCFTSQTLHVDMEVTGPVSVNLHAATDGPDTDWAAKLVDVWPDGRAMSVIDGIQRARYRDSLERPTLLEPDRPYAFVIDLVATSMVFKAGHRIRVEISSSNFPRFDRNPNNGGLSADVTESGLRAAKQRVFHDASRPSWINLPTIDRRA